MTSNRSFASQLKYNFLINRCPNVTFFVQEANIPGVTIGRAVAHTPFVHIYEQGDHLDYGTLDISFKVDESFDNWFEIHSWITGMAFPRKRKERADLKNSAIKNLDGQPVVPPLISEVNRKRGDVYSQITLAILNSHNKAIIQYDFVDAWPIGISPIQLSTKDDDVDYLTAQVSFSYTYYNVSKP